VNVVGRVQSVWRYPVKSMRGEKLDSVFVGFAGVYGDRLYAFRNSSANVGFPARGDFGVRRVGYSRLGGTD
jgi:uncharacterized protein